MSPKYDYDIQYLLDMAKEKARWNALETLWLISVLRKEGRRDILAEYDIYREQIRRPLNVQV